jgi:hypothetical protein
MRRRALAATSLVLAGLLGPTPARADAAETGGTGSARFALDPQGSESSSGYFQFRAAAGTALTGRIRIANLGSRKGTAHLYVVDATTGATTGAVYRDAREPRRGVGAWTRLSRTTVRLRPGSSTIVGFTTRVPAGMRTGDHLGGIVVEDSSVRTAAPAGGNRSRFRIRIRKLTVIALQVRVPGARTPGLALTSLRAGGEAGRQSLFLGIRNTGNVLVKGRGHLVVTKGGRTVQDQRFPLDTFVPRTAVELPLRVRGPRALRDGDYRAVAVLRYRGRTVRRAFTFSISKKAVRQVFGTKAAPLAPVTDSPLLTMLAGAGIAAAGFALAALLATRRRRGRDVVAAPRVRHTGGAGPGDTPVVPARPRPPHSPAARRPGRSRGPRERTPEERERAWRERQAQRQRDTRV